VIDTRSVSARPCRGRDTLVDDFRPSRTSAAILIWRSGTAGFPCRYVALGPPADDDERWTPVDHSFNGMIYQLSGCSCGNCQSRLPCRGRWTPKSSFRPTPAGARIASPTSTACGPSCCGQSVRILLASRDRIGVKPLVYRVDDDRALFARRSARFFHLARSTMVWSPGPYTHFCHLCRFRRPTRSTRRRSSSSPRAT